MKRLLFILTLALLCSCEHEPTQNDELDFDNQSVIDLRHTRNNSETDEFKQTNWFLIQDELNEYVANSRKAATYSCSEDSGGYTSLSYLTNGYYLNSFYAPSNPDKINNLEDLLRDRFEKPGANGNNSAMVDIEFEVLGAGGGTFLNATNANRAYNEFICELINIYPGFLSSMSVECNLSISLDYMLCCDGSSCCNPLLIANGTMYW